MLAVVVWHSIIEEVVHLLDLVEMAGEPGLLDTLIARAFVRDAECGYVTAFNSLDECFDLQGYFGLAEVGVEIVAVHD